MSIAVIAGLGNPGPKYRETRHNIGFAVIDKYAAQLNVSWKVEPRFEAELAIAATSGRKLLLVKPSTYMNASGRSLGAVLRYRKFTAEQLLVIYDDITLEVGRTKLSRSGSSGGHNGVTDILEQVGPGFLRYRIGIGAKPDKEMDLADFVLGKFPKNEQILLADRMSTYLEHLALIVDKDSDSAMNFINQRTAS